MMPQMLEARITRTWPIIALMALTASPHYFRSSTDCNRTSRHHAGVKSRGTSPNLADAPPLPSEVPTTGGDGLSGKGFPSWLTYPFASTIISLFPMADETIERRTHGRVPVQLPVIVRGTDSGGRGFFDRAQIVSLDARGARLHTRFHLKEGSQVIVEMPAPDDSHKPMRVVWSGEAGGFYDGVVGLELVTPEDVWDVEALRIQWGARNY